MNRERTWLVLSGAMPALLVAAFWLGRWSGSAAEAGEAAVVGEAMGRIGDSYREPREPQRLRQAAIEGMMRSLDDYCDYFTEEEWKKFNEDELQGKFGGVGIVVEADPDGPYILVVNTMAGSPAMLAGILPGDRIVSADGNSLKEQGVVRAVQWIRGEIGTPVTLTIWRKDKDPFDVRLIRGNIEVPALHAKMLDPVRGIGYLRVIQFQKLMEEFDRKIVELQSQGMKALIVDLRFNGGGLLQECVKLSNRFLDRGVIVTTRGRNSRDNKEYEAETGERRVTVPLVVLVNESTASASEIFAAAMKDHGRGVLVGSRTFGKGSVQTPLPLSDGSWIKLTTAHYYTPSGFSVQREKGKKEYGVEPHHVIQTTEEESVKIYQRLQSERYGRNGEKEIVDPQIEAALEIAKAKLENREPLVEPRIVGTGPKDGGK